VLLIFYYIGLYYLIPSALLSLYLLYLSFRLIINPSKEEAMRSFIFSNIYLMLIFLLIVISKLI
ncbi:MAG: protoheme IX farnesyltransferase, partial [Saccharolobus sp.]